MQLPNLLDSLVIYIFSNIFFISRHPCVTDPLGPPTRWSPKKCSQ